MVENNHLLDSYPEKIESLREKLARKRRNLVRESFAPQPFSSLLKIGEYLGLAMVLALNFFLLLPFFGQPDQANVFSAPLIPLLTYLTDFFIPSSYGVRVWLLASLIFFPWALYFFVKDVSGRKLAGFLAAIIVSLPAGLLLEKRVEMAIFGSDGAYIASLVFIPLVGLLFLRFLHRGGFKSVLFSALGTTLVALTSPLGLFVLSVFMTVLAFSEMLLGQGRLKLLRWLVVLAGAVGFSAFWYNPKFVLLVINSPEGQILWQTFTNLVPLSFFLVPLIGVFGFLVFENRVHLQSLFIALFLTIGFSALSFGSEISVFTSSRFLPALGMAMAFFLGVVGVRLFDFLHHSSILESPKLDSLRSLIRYRRLISHSLALLVVFLLTFSTIFLREDLVFSENPQVLGLTSIQRAGLWEIKEKTSILESLLGYLISGGTVLGTVILKKKLK